MGKESQLLEAARDGNLPKVEKLLGKKRKHLTSSASEAGDGDGQGVVETACSLAIAEADKLNSTSVDVNCVDADGSTPLILAALLGHREVASLLLLYSANVNAENYLGNTALHMAAWHSKSEIIDILLMNGVNVDKQDVNGYTALHFAAQHCIQGKIFTISKLLQGKARIDIKNRDGDTPLDLAARFGRREVVSMLLDSNPEVVSVSVRPLVLACQSGRMEVAEILLEAGMEPNAVEDTSGTSPLHEAVRFFRQEIAKLLLEFGADPDNENRLKETPRAIVAAMSETKRDKFSVLFDDFKSCEKREPKVYRERAQSVEDGLETNEPLSIVYPRLCNRTWWTANDRSHCSVVSMDHPCTALLDGNLDTFWMIPEAGGYNWVVFDFGSPFLLNGVRIYGWEDKETLRHFTMETGESLSGPWTKVGKYCCELVKPEEPDELAAPQDFRGFYGVSQYWRLTVCSNFGKPETRVRGVQFYGIEEGVLEWFKDLDAMKYCKQFVEKGYNQLSDVARLDQEALKEVVPLPGHQKKLLISIRKLRERCVMLTRLEWSRTPPTLVAAGELLPPISVRGDPHSLDRVKLVVHGGAQLSGETVVSMVPQEGKRPSKAHFRDITLSPMGKYWLEVQCEQIPNISIKASEPITVAPAPKRGEELDRAFADIENLLIF